MTATDNDFRRPLTAQEAVLAELRRLILAGHLHPGSPIRQDVIATSLGVSRVPVREALKILEGEGQITYRPHRGYFVTELTFEDVQEIYRIRELLESEALRVGVPKLTDEDLATMAECLEDMEAQAGATGAMSESNARFHLTLLNASGMAHLLKHIRLLRDATDAYRSLYYMSDQAVENVRGEHRAIYEAAAARDPERVIGYANEHREHTVEALRILLDGD
jgi:DNA-binding GntR family transcriptional regulator